MGSLPVSVVVIARNASGILARCLESIKANDPAEIVVIDGNSSDNTVEIASRYTSRIFSDGGKGAAFARQLGAEKAMREFIAYIDADVTLKNGTLSIMLEQLRGSTCTGVRARQVPSTKPTNYWGLSQFEAESLSTHKRDRLGMPACVVRKDAILKFKFDDFVFRGAEDSEIETRMIKAGCKFALSSAEVMVNYPPSLKVFWRQRYLHGGGKALILWLHGPFNPEVWPPIVAAYWVYRACLKRKFSLIPYFIVDFLAQMQGLTVYSAKLAAGKIKKLNREPAYPGSKN